MMDNVIILPARTYNKNQKYLLEHICSLIDFLEKKARIKFAKLALSGGRQLAPSLPKVSRSR